MFMYLYKDLIHYRIKKIYFCRVKLAQKCGKNKIN